ncbi:MAG: tetratricopeptide repeat protein, partial [Candidatus Latescibacteria bacterium]|nr:tetratricopeptide repeat protein [Candidatus Latescibacterota bacterium]
KRQGKVDLALDMYESSTHLSAEGHHNLGLIYAERGLWDQSLSAYGQALALAPDMSIAHFSMAGVQLLQGDIEAASERFEIFLENWQGKPDYVRDATLRLRQIYPVLGDQYLRAQRFGDAGQVYERLLMLGDNAPSISNNLVLIYGRLGQFDKAVKFGQLALRDHPGFIQMHLSLGTVYESRGDRERALMHYRKFINQSASDAPLVKRALDRITRLIQP